MEFHGVGVLRATPAFPAFVPTFGRCHFCVVNDDRISVFFNVSDNDAITFVRFPDLCARVRPPPCASVFREAGPVDDFWRAEIVRIRSRKEVSWSSDFQDGLSDAPKDYGVITFTCLSAIQPEDGFHLRDMVSSLFRHRFKRVVRYHFVSASMGAVHHLGNGEDVNYLRFKGELLLVGRFVDLNAHEGQP